MCTSFIIFIIHGRITKNLEGRAKQVRHKTIRNDVKAKDRDPRATNGNKETANHKTRKGTKEQKLTPTHPLVVHLRQPGSDLQQTGHVRDVIHHLLRRPALLPFHPLPRVHPLRHQSGAGKDQFDSCQRHQDRNFNLHGGRCWCCLGFGGKNAGIYSLWWITDRRRVCCACVKWTAGMLGSAEWWFMLGRFVKEGSTESWGRWWGWQRRSFSSHSRCVAVKWWNDMGMCTRRAAILR